MKRIILAAAACLALAAPAHAQSDDAMMRQTERVISDYTAGTRALMFHSDNQRAWNEQLDMQRQALAMQRDALELERQRLNEYRARLVTAADNLRREQHRQEQQRPTQPYYTEAARAAADPSGCLYPVKGVVCRR